MLGYLSIETFATFHSLDIGSLETFLFELVVSNSVPVTIATLFSLGFLWLNLGPLGIQQNLQWSPVLKKNTRTGITNEVIFQPGLHGRGQNLPSAAMHARCG